MVATGLLILIGLFLLSGCGQRYVNVNLIRPPNFDKSVWVGVYFLSQETALDDLDNIVLADPDNENELAGRGVVHKEIFPLYPAEEAHLIQMPKYDPAIRFIVVVAGIPDANPCARQSYTLKENAELTIYAILNEKCIDLRIE